MSSGHAPLGGFPGIVVAAKENLFGKRDGFGERRVGNGAGRLGGRLDGDKEIDVPFAGVRLFEQLGKGGEGCIAASLGQNLAMLHGVSIEHRYLISGKDSGFYHKAVRGKRGSRKFLEKVCDKNGSIMHFSRWKPVDVPQAKQQKRKTNRRKEHGTAKIHHIAERAGDGRSVLHRARPARAQPQQGAVARVPSEKAGLPVRADIFRAERAREGHAGVRATGAELHR